MKFFKREEGRSFMFRQCSAFWDEKDRVYRTYYGRTLIGQAKTADKAKTQIADYLVQRRAAHLY